ncbi:hypothetical protein B484DRAFT_411972, partial [Ochromonadaceae sp. CCMP2298]
RQADVLRRIEGALLPMSYPMLDWAREGYWSGVSRDTAGDSDYLTTRYQLAPKPNAKTDKRLLQRQDVADLIKASAVAFDLPPHRFSTSSCRRFAGSTDVLTMPEVKVRGGWAAGSTVMEQNYRRNPEGRGAFAVAGDGGEFTHQQLVGLTRKPLATCPSLSNDADVADDDPYDMGVEDEWDCGTGTLCLEGLGGALWSSDRPLSFEDEAARLHRGQGSQQLVRMDVFC